MANLGSFLGIPQDLTSREAPVIHHTFGMERREHPKQILGSSGGDLATHGLASRPPLQSFPGAHCALDKDGFSSSQAYNSFIPSHFPLSSSNQRPGTVDTCQSFHAHPVMAVLNFPPNPLDSHPSILSHAYHLRRPPGNFINSTIYPDEGQLVRCYPRVSTALCDKRRHEYGSHMPGSQTSLAVGHLTTLTVPADNTAVHRAFVTPRAVALAATLRRTPGRAAPHVCRLCDARFTAGHNLKNHIYSHLGVRPYLCKGCQRRFVTKHDCRRHERTCKDIPRHTPPFA